MPELVPRNSIAYVDWANLYTRLKEGYEAADWTGDQTLVTRRVLGAVQTIAEEDIGGDLRHGSVYADWSGRSDAMRVVESLPNWKAINVPRRGGKDRADNTLQLDLYDAAKAEPKETSLILVAGDGGYCEVVRRGVELGKRVYVVALRSGLSGDLQDMGSAFFALDQRLGVQMKFSPPPQVPPTLRVDLDQYGPILWKVYKLISAGLPYIVRSYLVRQLVDLDPNETRERLQQAAGKGYLRMYPRANPKLPGATVTCVELNWDNQATKNIVALMSHTEKRGGPNRSELQTRPSS